MNSGKLNTTKNLTSSVSKRTGLTGGVSSFSRTRNVSGTADRDAGVKPFQGAPKPLVPPNKSPPAEVAEAAAKEKIEEHNLAEEAAVFGLAQASPDKAKPKKSPGLTKEELERPVDILLTETETDTLLVFPSLCVALDNPNSAAVSARIKAYDELVASKADKADKYREQHAQTLNHPHKSKDVHAQPPAQENAEVNANGWDIHDTFSTDPVPRHVQIQQACDKEAQDAAAQAMKKPGCLFDMNDPCIPTDAVSKEGSGRRRDDRKRGGLSAGISGKVSSLGAGASRALAAGNSHLGAGSSHSGSLTAPLSGMAPSSEKETAPTPAPVLAPAGDTPQAASVTAPGGAEPGEGAAAEVQEEEPDEPKPPTESMPWKVGAGNPIPEELSQALRTMERIVSQNVFHKQHMIYRNYPTLEELAKLDELRADEATAGIGGGTSASGVGGEVSGTGRRSSVSGEGAEGSGEGEGDDAEDSAAADNAEEMMLREEGNAASKPSLQDLFCFDAPQLTQGTTVTCAEWNRANQDLLAVSYGDTSPVPNTSGGLVLFWSLKNPTYPERVLRTRSGVTALHFSSEHANFVAAGTHDGSILIWDLRRPTDQPVLKSGSSVSTHNDQKHTDIVWEVKWVDRGADKQPQEVLSSVSSDGNVLQWSMKKGLEQTLLMLLKRQPNQHLGSNSVYGHKEGIVFRKSSGFCIDFPKHDPQTYLVGTEDGLVHRCSTSYSEQYLDTYQGHSGPVYRVRCNPFMSHAFLTCSADWTMRLWTTKPVPGHQPDAPLVTLQSTDLCDAVNDVIWAPNNSTSFAAAMDDGRVELWDLSEKRLDPIVVHYPQASQPQRRRTCVRFSPNSPVLIAGDNQGSVDVMRMYNTNQSYYSDQEQQDRLNDVMVKKR